MLNKNIINVKNILKIIISVLFIFSALKSCTNAMTTKEAFEICEELCGYTSMFTSTGNTSTNYRSKAQYIEYLETVPNKALAIWKSSSENSKFCLLVQDKYEKIENKWYRTATTEEPYYEKYCYSFNNLYYKQRNWTTTESTVFANYNDVTKDFYMIMSGGQILEANFEIPATITWTENTTTVVDEYENIENVWAYYMEYNFQNIKLGTLEGYEEDSNYTTEFKFKNKSGIVLDQLFYYNGSQNADYMTFTNGELYIPTRILNYNTIYYLEITVYTGVDDGTAFYYEMPLYFYPAGTVIENGVIVESSSGDYSTQNSTNDIINDVPKNIAKEFYNSGDNEEKGIIQKVYEDLFTVSSGEIQNSIQTFYEDMGYDSGEVSDQINEATAGLDVINGNYGDFVISWEAFNPNLTVKGQAVNNNVNMIPAGEINFSQFERDNPKIHDVMIFVRAILSFSIFVMLGKNVWNTLMTTLGLSTSIYDKTTEESRTAKENEEKWKNQLEKQRYNEWLRNHRK